MRFVHQISAYVEKLESRDLLAADCGIIEGIKWEDANGNGEFDRDESTLAGWTIYLDVNQNGTLDEGELSAVTGEDGTYRIEEVPPGSYFIREVLQEGWQQTFPRSFDLEAALEGLTAEASEVSALVPGRFDFSEGFTGFEIGDGGNDCLLYTSPSPRDQRGSRMPSSA